MTLWRALIVLAVSAGLANMVHRGLAFDNKSDSVLAWGALFTFAIGTQSWAWRMGDDSAPARAERKGAE